MRTDGWNVYLVQTVSGQIGPRLNCSSHSWTIPLSGMETGSITARVRQLKQIDTLWFSPDSGSVLLTYTYQGVERPWIAGPITQWSNETDEEMQIDFTGIRGLLEGRLALRGDSIQNKKDVTFSGQSLGAIAQDVVTVCQNRPGGSLPIRYASPYELVSPGHQRTYQWFNLSNLNVDEVLTKLSEVIDGPDIMFRPEWRSDDDHAHIVWSMYHGTEHQPLIAQDWAPDFDVTARDTGIAKFNAIRTGSRRVSRVYATGAGQDAGTLIRSAEDLSSLDDGFPYRETVISEPDMKDANTLTNKAKEHLRANKDTTVEVSMVVRADHEKAPLARWHVGDKAVLTTKDRIALPAGTYHYTITQASGDHTQDVQLKFQED